MLTRVDFKQAGIDTLANYPELAVLYRMRDPILMQHLDAIATMLAMYSAQLEVGIMEPFLKVRDATILADAAMRGIIPAATPAKARIKVKNNGSEAHHIDAGRTLIDSNGLPWITISAVDVDANAETTLDANQYRTTAFKHTVRDTYPYYAIEIPKSEDGAYLAGIYVYSDSEIFVFRDRYVNTWPGDPVFHVEADEKQRIYVRFGVSGVVGVQPSDGDEITLQLGYSHGAEAQPRHESPFSFSYIQHPLDSQIELMMDAVLQAGQNPIDMATMRDIARYPAVYNRDAVYLGEFDFLIRSKFHSLKYLSVWNEGAEERARGASLDNINRLFVACVSTLETETIITDQSASHQITEENLTDTQKSIRQTIWDADDSYKVSFYAAVRYPVTVTITAKVSTNYAPADVKQQIRDIVLSAYGESSTAAKRRTQPTHQDLYALITSKVQALKSGNTELILVVGEIPVNTPEIWMYVAPETLLITVETLKTLVPKWGY